MDLWIDEEKKREVIELAKINVEKDIATEKLWNSLTMEADKEEKWLEENRKTIIEQLLNLREKMTQKETEIKEKQKEEAEAKAKWASIDEVFEIRKIQLNLIKEQISLKQEYESIESIIATRYETYTWEKWDLSKMLVETWVERENRIKEIKNKKKERDELIHSHRHELDELEKSASLIMKGWSLPSKTLAGFHEKDRIVVKNGDQIWYAELFDYRLNWYYGKAQENGISVFVKVWDKVDRKVIIYEDADLWIFNESKKYTKIIDAEIEWDILKVRLGKNEWEKWVMYEFKINEM